jgi:hypothetical protein
MRSPSSLTFMAWSLLLSFLASLLTRLLLVVHLQNWSVTAPSLRLVRKFVVYYTHMAFLVGRVSHTSNTRTQLSGNTKQWSNSATLF